MKYFSLDNDASELKVSFVFLPLLSNIKWAVHKIQAPSSNLYILKLMKKLSF